VTTKIGCFQRLPFQAAVQTLLKPVVRCCGWRLSAVTNLSTCVSLIIATSFGVQTENISCKTFSTAESVFGLM
jgi:hypothetical protein